MVSSNALDVGTVYMACREVNMLKCRSPRTTVWKISGPGHMATTDM